MTKHKQEEKMTAGQHMCQNEEKGRGRRRGKAESSVGPGVYLRGGGRTTAAWLASERQAARQTAHSRDGLPGEFYHAPLAG